MSPSGRFFVFGAGGHGKVVADAGVSSGLVLAGFLDDAAGGEGALVLGVPVFTWDEFRREQASGRGGPIALGVGENATREKVYRRILEAGFAIAAIVHRGAVIAPSASIGPGTVIMAGAVVNPEARVGNGVILNTGSIVEHDVVLEDFVHLSPNVALGGGVRIGPRSHLGLGAVVLPLVKIGADVRVGAGAAVIRDVPDGVTVAGVPASEIRSSGRG